MTQDIGNFSLIKNELLRKVVMYYAKRYNGSIKKAIKEIKGILPKDVITSSFIFSDTPQGNVFWYNIHSRFQLDPATELTEYEIKILQPIIDKINEQCK